MAKGWSFIARMAVAVIAALVFGLFLRVGHMIFNGAPFFVVDGASIRPLRYFEIRLERTAFDAFERQVGVFAATFGFDSRSRQSSPDLQDVLFWLERGEIDLVGGSVLPNGPVHLVYQFGFYPKRGRPPPPAETVDGLVDDFKQSLAPLERVTVTEIASAP